VAFYLGYRNNRQFFFILAHLRNKKLVRRVSVYIIEFPALIHLVAYLSLLEYAMLPIPESVSAHASDYGTVMRGNQSLCSRV
jgi:hypothetical protein